MAPSSVRVAVVGASNLTYSEVGPEGSLLPLPRLALSRLAPDATWECLPAPVRMSREVAAPLGAMVEEMQPDVLVLTLTATPFAQDFVTNRIRRRWPKMHRMALRASQRLKIGAKETDPVFTPRRLLYRIPDAIAYRLIGGEPYYTAERAVAGAKDAIDCILRFEEVVGLCRLPRLSEVMRGRRRQLYADRVDVFNAAVSEHCRRKHMPYFMMGDEFEAAGVTPTYIGDGLHFDLPTRTFEADAIARHVLRVLEPSRLPAQLATV